MHRLAEQPVRLVLVLGPPVRPVHPPMMDALLNRPPDTALARVPAMALHRNVGFHARLGVDLEFARVDRRPEAGVELARVGTFAVAFRVVDVLDGQIAAEPALGDLAERPKEGLISSEPMRRGRRKRKQDSQLLRDVLHAAGEHKRLLAAPPISHLSQWDARQTS